MTTLPLAAIAVVVSGCGGSSSNDASDDPSEPVTIASTKVDYALDEHLDDLRPDQLELNISRDLPVAGLNEWAKALLGDMLDPDVNEDELRAALEKHIDPSSVDRVLRRRFTFRDASYIRDMLWAETLVSLIRAEEPGVLNQIVELFYYTMHNIRLVPDGDPDIPLGPFEIVLYGRGTAVDRAWVFSTILHSMKIPAVILERPESAQGVKWNVLVGAVLDGKTYLFDASIGLPLPASDDTTDSLLIRSAATLTDLLKDETPLRKLDVGDNRYPLTVDLLKTANVRIVGDTCTWSRRMEGLSAALSGKRAVNLYRPLLSNGKFDGDLAVVSETLAGLIPANQIHVWSYPESRRQSRETLTDDQSKLLADLKASFQVPEPIERLDVTISDEVVVDGKLAFSVTGFEVGPGERQHRRARVHQMVGELSKAVRQYVKTQTWKRMPPISPGVLKPAGEALYKELGTKLSDEDFSRITARQVQNELSRYIYGSSATFSSLLPEGVHERHAKAAEEALFWRGCCQLQRRQWKTASDDFEAYLRSMANGSFTGSAYFLSAISQAHQGEKRRAVAFLERVESTDPVFTAAQILSRRWSAPTEIPAESK